MKHIHLIIKFTFLTFLLISCTPQEPEGIFTISPEAQKYKIDQTITSFQMIDNNGITEQFNINNYDSYFHEVSENTSYEIFNIQYSSVINNYYFDMHIRANDISNRLNISWNYKNYLNYNFETDEIFGEPAIPEIKFYDSIQIQNETYFDIIEIDYTNCVDKIDNKTPIKTFISGKMGLIKLLRKDGNVLIRITD